jgi:hypothetical protein
MDDNERIVIHGCLAAVLKALVEKNVITNDELNQYIIEAEKESAIAIKNGQKIEPVQKNSN